MDASPNCANHALEKPVAVNQETYSCAAKAVKFFNEWMVFSAMLQAWKSV